MGQDRQFNKNEIDFALQTVHHFKSAWENSERINLEQDVKWKVEAHEYDRVYKEHFEVQDNHQLDQFVDDEIQKAQNLKTAEGEDELNEQQKEEIAKEKKFVAARRGFYAPLEAAEFKAKQEAEVASASGPQPSQAEVRVQSAMSSIKSGKHSVPEQKSAANEDANESGPPYHPLVPEQWQEKLREFSKLHIIKHRRVFQCLFYLLRYRERQEICLRDTNQLEWKKCRKLFEKHAEESQDLFFQIGNYWPFGAKEGEYREYQKL